MLDKLKTFFKKLWAGIFTFFFTIGMVIFIVFDWIGSLITDLFKKKK